MVLMNTVLDHTMIGHTFTIQTTDSVFRISTVLVLVIVDIVVCKKYLFCPDLSTDVGKDEEAFSDLEIGDSDEEILNKINPNENEEEGQLQVFKESVIKILLVCFFC